MSLNNYDELLKIFRDQKYSSEALNKSGLFINHADSNKFHLFRDLTAEPNTTGVIDTSTTNGYDFNKDWSCVKIPKATDKKGEAGEPCTNNENCKSNRCLGGFCCKQNSNGMDPYCKQCLSD